MVKSNITPDKGYKNLLATLEAHDYMSKLTDAQLADVCWDVAGDYTAIAELLQRFEKLTGVERDENGEVVKR